MTPAISQKLRDWDRSTAQVSNNRFVDEGEFIAFLSAQLFDAYEPTVGGGHLEFRYRLQQWLDCGPDEAAQKAMIRLAARILFFGIKEIEASHIAVLNRSVIPWLIETLSISIDDPDLNDRLDMEIGQTWFTSVSDSMRLNSFYHVNNIEGVDWRLDWLAAIRGGTDVAVVERYLAMQGLKRVVVLEDFVGTGSQLRQASNLFMRLTPKIPILVCPLFVCSGGIVVGEELSSARGSLSFRPLLPLQDDYFVSGTPITGEPRLHAEFRKLAIQVHNTVVGSGWSQDYGPFGFGGVGGLVVMQTNCPDNSLPLIHRSSDGPWYALFPRSSRL